MVVENIVLILSGQITHKEPHGLYSFWSRFIELQRKLPAACMIDNIFAHSWNPEYERLIEITYSPRANTNEAKRWSDQKYDKNICHALDEIKSRSNALKLATECQSSDHFSRAVMVSWNLSEKGNYETDGLVFDDGLPKEWTYLAYHSHVDYGYACHWIICPWKLAHTFTDFDQFSKRKIEELSQNKNFVTSIKQFFRMVKITLSDVYSSHVFTIGKLLFDMRNKSLATNRLSRLRYKLFDKLLKTFNKGRLSEEISYYQSEKNEAELTWPPNQQLQNYLFKLFANERGLRNNIRFLLANDFETAVSAGKLISPTPYILVCSSCSKPSLPLAEKLFAESPLPVKAVYFVVEDAVHYFFNEDEKIVEERNLSFNGLGCPSSFNDILIELQRIHPSNHPRIVLSNVEPFLECADWPYLNAVLKYLIFTDSECGVFDTSEAGAPNSHFPNLDCHSADISASFCAGILTLNAVNKLSEVSVESSDTGGPHSHNSIVWPFDFFAHKAPLFQQITADE